MLSPTWRLNEERTTNRYNPCPSYPTFLQSTSINSCKLSLYTWKKHFGNKDQHGHYHWCSSTIPPKPLQLSMHMSLSSSPVTQVKKKTRGSEGVSNQNTSSQQQTKSYTASEGYPAARHHHVGPPLSFVQLHIWANSCTLLLMHYQQFHSQSPTEPSIIKRWVVFFFSNAQALQRVTKQFFPSYHHCHIAQEVLGSTKVWFPSKFHLLQRGFRIV